MQTRAEIVKDWLTAYRNEEKQIDEQLERLRELRARAMSIGPQEISDMPRAPLKIKDSLAEYVIRAEEIEMRLSERMRSHERDRAALLSLLGKMKRNEERRIIRLRYLFGYEWMDILAEIYKDEEGFAEHREKYRRRMYRAHESALMDMGRLWK